MFSSATKLLFYSQPSYQFVLLLLDQVQMKYDCHASWMVGTWGQFLSPEPPHTESSTLSICTMLCNSSRLIDHKPRDRIGKHEARSKSRNERLLFWVSKFSPLQLLRRLVAPRSGIIYGILQHMLCLRSGIVPLRG